MGDQGSHHTRRTSKGLDVAYFNQRDRDIRRGGAFAVLRGARGRWSTGVISRQMTGQCAKPRADLSVGSIRCRNTHGRNDMHSALITGTSTGIGLETALLFARRGFRVYAAARNPAASEGLQRAVADGLSLTPIALDVDRDESVRHDVAQVGPVDVLVNNAGIASSAAVELMPMEEIRALFETNVFGAVRMMQAVLPSLRERRAGAIVNVTSIAGRITVPCNGYYAATKSAVATLTETLAMEVRPFGIRVANIQPGVILTPIWGKREPAAPEVSDYGQGLSRTLRLVLAQMEGGTSPDVVAEAIYRAATEDGPLHVLVGDDSRVFAMQVGSYFKTFAILCSR